MRCTLSDDARLALALVAGLADGGDTGETANSDLANSEWARRKIRPQASGDEGNLKPDSWIVMRDGRWAMGAARWVLRDG